MGSSDGGLRTLLVGVDAAGPAVLEPLFDAGVVPRLRELFDGGASGPLPARVPPWTPSAWTTIATGTNPGKHGVFGFLGYDGYDWDVVDATDVRRRPLWQVLDLHGLASVVVNVPVTHPPEPFDGALVPGYVAPEDPGCHPDGLLAEVREAVDGYRVYPPSDPAIADYCDLVRSRGAAFRYLADRFDPAFGFLQFQATDTVFHDRPGDRDAVEAVYGAVDDELGTTLDALDPDTVVVVSDHGMGEYGGHEFRVNEFLRERGFLSTRRGGGGMPTWSTIRERRLKPGERGGGGASGGDPGADHEDGAPARDAGERDDGGRRPAASLAERTMAGLARLGVTSQRVQRALATVGLDDVVARHVPDDVARAGAEQVDFAASRAYVRSRIECGVRVNLEGREPSGVVPEDEYEAVRSALIEALSAVTTPDGEPVFEEVTRREEHFHGPAAGDAVDVVTVPADYDQFLSATLAGEQFGPPSEPWNHKREGVVAAAGDAVDADAPLGDPRQVDVAPTVLATLGVPADEGMDGAALPVVPDAGERAYPAFERDAAGGDADDAVQRRLEDMGYIE